MVREEDGRLVLWAPGPRLVLWAGPRTTAAELSFFAVESSAAELSFFAVEGCVAKDGDAPVAVNEAKEAEPSVDSGFVDFRPTSRSNPGGPSDTVVPLRVVDFRPTEVVDSVLVDFRPTPRSNPGGSSEKRRGLEEVVKEVPDDRTLDRASVCEGVLIEAVDPGAGLRNLEDFRPGNLALRNLADFRPAGGSCDNLELGAVREDFALGDNLEEREVIDEVLEGPTIRGDTILHAEAIMIYEG